MIDWTQITGFDWDEGNARKNVEKHDVSQPEAEQAFFNRPLVSVDALHSKLEPRYHALGTTDSMRRLPLTFTVRSGATGMLIRVISARNMHGKERSKCEQTKKNPEFQTEAEERAFWESHDSTEYIDWDKAQPASFQRLSRFGFPMDCWNV